MAVGGGEVRAGPPSSPLPSGPWAAAGLAAVLAGAVVVATAATRPLQTLGALMALAGSSILIVVAVAAVVRHQLRRQADFVARTVARGMLDSLPPGRVIEHLLDRVYGPSPSNRAVATAVIGGEGEAHDGGDLTVSRDTEIDFELTRMTESTYRLVVEQRYVFRDSVPTSRLVIFATSDYELRDRIIAGCRTPLFDLWFFGVDHAGDYFEEAVENMRDTFSVGMEYRDTDGQQRTVEVRSRPALMEDVKLRDWGRYLTFFRTDLPEDQVLPHQMFMDRLRIFELDLRLLAHDRSSVESIEQLVVRSSTLQRIAAGYCYWEAPYPCHVARMGFDTTRMVSTSGASLMFHLKPFTLGSPASPVPWSSADQVFDVRVDGWVLPGHGIALMWREA